MPLAAIISAITGFFVSAFMKIWGKAMLWYFTGALKLYAIYIIACVAFYAAISWLAGKINTDLGNLLQGIEVPTYASPFLSALPSNTSDCMQICLATYLVGAAYNISKEVAKLKLRMAERAAGFSRA